MPNLGKFQISASINWERLVDNVYEMDDTVNWLAGLPGVPVSLRMRSSMNWPTLLTLLRSLELRINALLVPEGVSNAFELQSSVSWNVALESLRGLEINVQVIQDGQVPAVAPSAFVVGDWTLADLTTGGDARITIVTLPANGGSVITDLQRKVGAGAWVTLGGTAAGSYDLVDQFVDGVSTPVLVRAVNAIGAGADSDSKSVTTTLTVAPTAPAAFTAGQWSLADLTTGGDARITINALPANGGSPLTALQYSLNGGAWIGLGAAATGTYDLLGLFTDGVSTDVAIRVVNAIGSGPGNTKAVTTTLAPSASAPAQSLAPSLSVVSSTRIDTTLGTPQADGGSPITSNDLRISTDQVNWTVAVAIAVPFQWTGLVASTQYFVQTRAVNAIGAGPWSVSASAVTAAVSTADFVVTTQVEFGAVFTGNSDAQLAGKVIEYSGTGLTELIIPGGRNINPPVTIRAANGSSSVQRIRFVGGTKGFHFKDCNVIAQGLPTAFSELIFWEGVGTYAVTFDGGVYRGQPIPIDVLAQLPQYERRDHNVVASTTSQSFGLTWPDPAGAFGWTEVFNNGAADIWFRQNDLPTDTATTGDTLLAAGQRYAPRSGRGNFFHVISAAGTVAVNARTEQGLQNYIPSLLNTGGATFVENFVFQNAVISDVANAFKRYPSNIGPMWFDKNDLRRVYQDVKAGSAGDDANARVYFTRNVFERPFSRQGVAQNLNGDAQDAHGDLHQNFSGTGFSHITSAGNTCLGTPLRAGAGNQGAEFWDPPTEGYVDCYVVGNILFIGSGSNGVTISQPDTGAHIGSGTEHNMVWGNTVIPVDTPLAGAGNSDGRYRVASNFGRSYVGNNIGNTIDQMNNIVLDGNASLFGGVITDYFPAWANLSTATARASVEAAMTAAGAALGIGGQAARAAGAIDWNATAPDQVVNLAALPPGVGWPGQINVATSTLVTLPLHKVMGGPVTQTVVANAGIEYQVTSDAAGAVIVTPWTSVNGNVTRGQFIQLRGTSSASNLTESTIGATINGHPVATVIKTAAAIPSVFFDNTPGTYFTDATGTTTSANNGQYVFELLMKPTSNNSGMLYQFAGSQGQVELLSGGSLRITIKDSANAFRVNAFVTLPGLVQAGVWQNIVIAVDLTASTFNVWIDGISALTVAMVAGVGTFQTSRDIFMLANVSGATKLAGQVARVAYYKNQTTLDGDVSGLTPYKVIAGNAATVNADAWKLGTDAV